MSPNPYNHQIRIIPQGRNETVVDVIRTDNRSTTFTAVFMINDKILEQLDPDTMKKVNDSMTTIASLIADAVEKDRTNPNP